jgi:hypothetical protein
MWLISLACLTHRFIGDPETPGFFAVCRESGDLSTISMAIFNEENYAKKKGEFGGIRHGSTHSSRFLMWSHALANNHHLTDSADA